MTCVIFHSADGVNHCDDGFAAAWCFQQKFSHEIDKFIPGVYGTPPPLDLVAGQGVSLVDFSYKYDDMCKLREVAKWIHVIDHHKTAKEELDKISDDDPGCPVEILFDLEKSGATLAWEWCFPGVQAPDLILRIEDNDLWRVPRRYDDSMYVQAALRSYKQTFNVWSVLMKRDIADLANEGAAIRRFIDRKVDELVAKAWYAEIGEYVMPVVNCPWFLASEVAGALAERHSTSMAACYFEQQNRIVYSLRGRGDADVSEIAKKFGGGGHKGAAGFQMPRV